VAESAKDLSKQFEEARSDGKQPMKESKKDEEESMDTLPKTTISAMKTGLTRIEAIPFLT
jgi:hypothetical protein